MSMRLALVLAAAGSFTEPAAAQEPAPPARVRWMSETGRSQIAPAHLICTGSVGGIRKLRGAAVVEVALKETLWGPEPDGDGVKVIATDVRSFRAGESCLFLLRRRAGGLYQELGRHILGNPEGDARLRVLRRILRIEAISNETEKAAQLRALLLGNLRGRAWERWHALRELWLIVERRPGFLRPEDITELEGLLALKLKRSFHTYLVSTICRAVTVPPLERYLAAPDHAARGAAVAELQAIPAVRRTAYLVGRLQAERSPSKRVRFCELFGVLAEESQVKELQARLTGDPAPVVRAAAATGLGWAGPVDATPLLEALRDDPAPGVRAAAAFVLARSKERRAIPLIEAELARGAVDVLQMESLKLALFRLRGQPASAAK
jgi:hypothetical protein